MIDGNAIVAVIVGSATDFLVELLPVWALIGGILLAFGIAYMLLRIVFPNRFARDDDDGIM